MPRKPSTNGRMLRIDAQADDVHRVAAPAHRDLHAIDEFDAVLRGGLGGFRQPIHIIMIGQRQHLHFASGGTRHQLGWGERAVGYVGMAMQIVVQHQRSPPPFFMTLPSSARLRRTSFGSAISGR